MKWTSQWVEICLDFLVRIVRSGCFSFDYLSVVCPNMGPQCVFVSEIWQSVGENFFRENAIKNSGSFSRNCPKNALPVALLLSYTILLHSPWVSLCFPARQFSSQPSWTPPPTKDCCDGANSLFSRNRTQNISVSQAGKPTFGVGVWVICMVSKFSSPHPDYMHTGDLKVCKNRSRFCEWIFGTQLCC